MKLLQVYNQYRSPFAGEEKVVLDLAELIERHGGSTKLLTRSSRDLGSDLFTKLKAFTSGVYSFEAARTMTRAIEEFSPTVVHAHNLYPLFSPSVLAASKKASVPVVVTLHNYFLTCPTWSHFCRGTICKQCFKYGEVCCLLRNCRSDLGESLAYCLRSWIVRKMGFFKKNVDLIICLTEFAKEHLIQAGFKKEKLRVLPNMVKIPVQGPKTGEGTYVGFAGRMDTGKGLGTLLRAARQLSDIPFKFAGNGSLSKYQKKATDNVTFVGHLNRQQMEDFYRNARIIVVPSELLEMSPLVISEAMAWGVPIIATRVGGIPETVEHRKTGILVEPQDTNSLAESIRQLWEDARFCRLLGDAGFQNVQQYNSAQNYYKQLMSLYSEVVGEKLG